MNVNVKNANAVTVSVFNRTLQEQKSLQTHSQIKRLFEVRH